MPSSNMMKRVDIFVVEGFGVSTNGIVASLFVCLFIQQILAFFFLFLPKCLHSLALALPMLHLDHFNAQTYNFP